MVPGTGNLEPGMTGFRFVMPYSVRIADINYGGHVSNAAVLSYFQDGRIAYLQNLGPFTELDIGEECGIILPEAHLHYRAEMFLGDALAIGVRVVEIRNSALVMEYRIERDGTVTADGRTPLVAYDYRARRPRRLPTAFREAVAAIEGL